MSKKDTPKFPQRGWLPPAAKKLPGWTAKKVQAVKAKREAAKGKTA